MKVGLTSLFTSEMQVKMTMRYNYIPNRKAKMNNIDKLLAIVYIVPFSLSLVLDPGSRVQRESLIQGYSWRLLLLLFSLLQTVDSVCTLQVIILFLLVCYSSRSTAYALSAFNSFKFLVFKNLKAEFLFLCFLSHPFSKHKQ